MPIWSLFFKGLGNLNIWFYDWVDDTQHTWYDSSHRSSTNKHVPNLYTEWDLFMGQINPNNVSKWNIGN